MRDFLDYVHILISKGGKQREEVVEVVVDLYFSYVRPWSRFLRLSEESKLAKDVVKLRNRLRNGGSTAKLRLRSKTLRADTVVVGGKEQAVSKPHVANLILDHLTRYEHIVLAVFIAEIVERETIRERLRWVSTLLLGALTGVLAFLGVLYAK